MARHHEVKGSAQELLAHIERTGRLRLIIPGAPRTKKNHNRLVKAGRAHKVLPSESWTTWRDRVVPLLRLVLARMVLGQEQAAAGSDVVGWAKGEGTYKGPMAHPVNCQALFYREALVGDAVGFYQGLADVLQEAGVVKDDKWIASWDGSRLRKDDERPRVELVLTWGVG